MIYFILGLILGIALSCLNAIILLRCKDQIDNFLQKTEQTFKGKPTGEVFLEDENKMELEQFLDSLPKE